MSGIRRTSLVTFAVISVGVAQAALDVAVDYARDRKQFGQAIVDFQAGAVQR